jgi:hypothetical protein
VQRILKHYEGARKQLHPDQTVNVQGVTVLGAILETKTVHAGAVLLNAGYTDEHTKTQATYVASFVFMRIGTKAISLSVVHPFDGAKSVTWTNQKLLDWISNIQRANPETK